MKFDGFYRRFCYCYLMRQHSKYLVILFGLVLFSSINMLSAQQSEISNKLAKVLMQQKAVGTFVVYDVSNDRLTLVNDVRAADRRIPASTFKIVNSLVALETKAVKDENELIPYGGKPQPIKVWEQDMSMRDGIKVSNVPVFQEIASRIGIDQFEKWLKVLNYGNGRIGKDVKTFWLEGPLKISAIEQAKFLSNLAQKKLSISVRSQEIVTDIIKLEQKGERILYGKTGWSSAPNPQIGWFVGWVKNERGIFSFALNMDILSKHDARKRKSITKNLLKILDIY